MVYSKDRLMDIEAKELTCPNLDDCCPGCINEFADGQMYYDDFDTGCCEHYIGKKKE